MQLTPSGMARTQVQMMAVVNTFASLVSSVVADFKGVASSWVAHKIHMLDLLCEVHGDLVCKYLRFQFPAYFETQKCIPAWSPILGGRLSWVGVLLPNAHTPRSCNYVFHPTLPMPLKSELGW